MLDHQLLTLSGSKYRKMYYPTVTVGLTTNFGRHYLVYYRDSFVQFYPVLLFCWHNTISIIRVVIFNWDHMYIIFLYGNFYPMHIV